MIQSIQSLPRELPLNVLVKTTLAEARQQMMPGIGALEETDGGVVLHGTVQDPDWMARYLSSLRWPFEVREPPALKTALKRHAAALLAAAG